MVEDDIELKKLEELTEIRKELQNIRVILQSKFVATKKGYRFKDENGHIRTVRTILEDPLGDLRKHYNINQ